MFLLCLGTFAASAQTVSLSGTWRFALDRAEEGLTEQWFKRALPDKIKLPGALQSQGYGDEITVNTPWVLTLYDHNWFLREDYQGYTNAGRVKVPFVCQPPRHYLGAAWYQRDFEIPKDWQDRRVVLFLERPRWESRVWLDDQCIGTNISLCAPHEYELGVALKPGKHRLTVRVDNRMIMAYRPDAHSVSDSLDSTWNGIIGKMELRSTPLVWIDDARVFPDVAAKSARVRLKVRNLSGTPGEGQITVVPTPPNLSKWEVMTSRVRMIVLTNQIIRWDGNGTDCDVNVPLDQLGNVQTWDEFNPALQRITVILRRTNAPNSGDVRELVFGLREIRADGNKILINGREAYLRGTHNGGDFPLTGYPPTDVESWKKIFRTCQAWGLNLMRFHSWCPTDAAFQAADELGFYLQPECGMWNDINPNTPMERMLYAETERIFRAYGNHPSFIMLSAMNEAHGRWKECLPQWVASCRTADPRRLYTPNTGWSLIDAPGPVEGADFLSVSRIGLNPLRGQSAWFGRDYSRSLRGVNVPVVAHELGQWCAYPDYGVIKKFDGYMLPGNYDIFRDSLAAHGLANKDKEFAWASGRFQLACYKEEIEANLRTPGLAGFQLLDLHDYVGQGSAFVGLLDTFWETKGYATSEEFKTFCDKVVPLARLTKRVFTSDETLAADIDVANYGAGPLTNQTVSWQILARDDDERATRRGSWQVQTIPVGKSFSLEQISANLAGLKSPGAYTLGVTIRGSAGVFANSWNFWLYPQPVSNAVPPDVFITGSWDEAETRLAAGGKVLFLPRTADLDWSSPPLADVPIFWNRLMNPGWTRMLGLWCDTKHPALAKFPTEANCDWQWTQIIRGVRAVNLDRLPRGLQPVVQGIDDWNRNWKLGLIFECNVGKGSLLVCAFDLERDLETRPVARQLRESLLDYMAGKKFRPKTSVTPAEFKTVLFDSRIMRKLGAVASGEGSGANGVGAAIDGDPNTFWIAGGTGRGMSGTPYPHELTIRFPAPVAMNGVVLMPRQNDREHTGDLRTYTITASDDGQQWRDVTHGALASTWSPQRVLFPEPLTAKQLRFTALSGFGKDSSAALAELAVIYAGPKLAGGDSGNIEYRRSRSTSTDVDEGPEAPASRTNSVPRGP